MILARTPAALWGCIACVARSVRGGELHLILNDDTSE
jgi:hypothetical protein